MRKNFPLLAMAMILSIAVCGGAVTITSAAGGEDRIVVFQKNKDDEYIDPQLLEGLTEDGEDYILLSGNDGIQDVRTGGGYAAAALSAQPDLSLLVPHSGGQIARSLTQDTATLSKLAPDASSISGLAPSSTDIAQMAPDPVDDISKLVPGAGAAIPGVGRGGTAAAPNDRDIIAGANGVIIGPDDVLNVAPTAGVAQAEDANGAAQAVIPDGQAIIDAVEALEEGETLQEEN